MQSSFLNPLPPPPPRSGCFVAGWSLQLLAVATLLAANAVLPKAHPSVQKYVLTSLVTYKPDLPVPQTPAVTSAPRVTSTPRLPVLKPLAVAKAALPTPVRTQPQPEIKIPELQAESKLPQLPAATAAAVVALNTFSTGSSALPTSTRPAATVQTGGFGDPQGVAPRGNSAPAKVSMGAVGAFDLPAGAGRGNGTGGAKAGVVASAGFGNGIAAGSAASQGVVRNAGFEAAYASPAARTAAPTSAQTSTPVAILYKPMPKYTDEGRKQGIDGEVRLEVLFTADGRVRVIRVLQGLGFGLDEQAVKAAEQIKFKPALHAGQPVDSTAVVHIIFQLAS